MSTDNQDESTNNNSDSDTGADQSSQASPGGGPTFTESPDPLAGAKKGVNEVMDSMEGKTVSMKTYVGSIVGVIVLMLLARCG